MSGSGVSSNNGGPTNLSSVPITLSLSQTPSTPAHTRFKDMKTSGEWRASKESSEPPLQSSFLSPRQRERLESRVKEIEVWELGMRKQVHGLFEKQRLDVTSGAAWKKSRPKSAGRNLEARMKFLTDRIAVFEHAVFVELQPPKEERENVEESADLHLHVDRLEARRNALGKAAGQLARGES